MHTWHNLVEFQLGKKKNQYQAEMAREGGVVETARVIGGGVAETACLWEGRGWNELTMGRG